MAAHFGQPHTLTAYNSQYSDKSFVDKRDLRDTEGHHIGFGASPLKLNLGLGLLNSWTKPPLRHARSV